MAINRNGQATKYNFLHNGSMLKKGYHNSSTLIWSASSTVTYVVDSSVEYTEEVDNGASCLSPTTFTPTRDGWTFVGWREDTTASSSVLSSKVMDSDPITLYAVFTKSCEARFASYTGVETLTGNVYYNNGNNTYFTGTCPSGGAFTGWTWRGWGLKADADATVAISAGSTFNCGTDTTNTFYGLYEKTITCRFVSYGKDESVSGTAYFNVSGNVKYPDITCPSYGNASGWTWGGWSYEEDTTADGKVMASVGAVLNPSAGFTAYGLYQITLTLTYYDNNTVPSSKTGTRYYNAYGTYKDPSFTMTQATKSGWSAEGWATSTDGNAGITYGNGGTFTINNSTIIYGRYNQTITLKTVANGTTSTQTGTICYNSGGYYVNPTFTVANPSKADTTFLGWDYTGDGVADVAEFNNTTVYQSMTANAVFRYDDITFDLAANGTTAGSKSMYIDTSIYKSVTAVNHNPDNDMGDVCVFQPDGNFLIHLCGESTATATFPSSGTYQFRAANNYAYGLMSGTFTLHSTGKTVVG